VNNKSAGDQGEQEVVDLVSCPNCKSQLMLLPPSFPMYDVQCTRCLFRAQVKTASKKPGNIVRGAGWDIYEKVLKAGNLAPPLIVNYHWADKSGEHQEVRFYPFIAKDNVKKYTLSETARRANYRMFNYVNLDKIPYLNLLAR
jgi:DNA-directed RNA polymerase subunit RPC12/RpoP